MLTITHYICYNHMNILLTGANGYIGQRLLPILLEQGHFVYCSVRNKKRFQRFTGHPNVETVEYDFLNPKKSAPFPKEIDIAYYLIHSMQSSGDFEEQEATSANNFINSLKETRVKQIIYLSGIVNEEQLSKHLSSRFGVEKILMASDIPVTVLRAGIIVGSGSASFEIMRDLVEKLPVMVTPKWLNTLCQPIAIRNVIQFLSGVISKPAYYNKDFDIGGQEVLTYKQMLLQFAGVRKLKRWIFTLPIMTPRLSSYWLYFITSTNYTLAVHLVNSMKVNVVCRPNNLAEELGIELLSYKTAVQLAFEKIEQNLVLSSWKDSFNTFNTNLDIMDVVEVPSFGCFKDEKQREIKTDVQNVMNKIWAIGGESGWYYGNTLWKIRGYIDKAFGGVGLRRGRTSAKEIYAGDSLDFWRVLVADKENRRLLLYAEMKLPGEAWLEFAVVEKEGKTWLEQTATFRPLGLLGRLYWYAVLPFHYFIFNGMINAIVKNTPKTN